MEGFKDFIRGLPILLGGLIVVGGVFAACVIAPDLVITIVTGFAIGVVIVMVLVCFVIASISLGEDVRQAGGYRKHFDRRQR